MDCGHYDVTALVNNPPPPALHSYDTRITTASIQRDTSVVEGFECLLSFRSRTPNLKVGGSTSYAHVIWISTAVYNIQHHQGPVPLMPCLYGSVRVLAWLSPSLLILSLITVMI